MVIVWKLLLCSCMCVSGFIVLVLKLLVIMINCGWKCFSVGNMMCCMVCM